MLPKRLTDGYQSFLAGRFPGERRRYAELGSSQEPDILVIGCCDSRVSPEVIFDVGPGELFVVRNVANIVPPCETGGEYHGTSAAIEFAVQGLNVGHIVVLGHASCGGIKAYADKAKPLSGGNFIGKWVSLVEPAVARAGDSSAPDYITRLEHAMVSQSIENLLTFPFVAERVADGRLALHGAHFGVATGDLWVRDPATGDFARLMTEDGKGLNPAALINCS
ncbi:MULTISPECIES: carbonic anhydrase [Methylobacterium]|jgi:carbonic anhydrase|uniref:Carbonic anhydrase n=4 Tax=Pseudomonadota TaxID=1224 RepID=A0ABQ4T163_9HYPH|nr:MULTISPECIES: carbonic anhydrase [Methylobacterium]PIU04780.1 MAG: carbonate dehydratase [Methylobacterium sp. CG09_land_8_20_14_0_10_71_15]PIU16256.1 MAG: carbonate dehydratase [Methylobacterium sp. CG08_land_8_20_14_0_20_71_15]GBU17186.1 carbonic anhydrase [Methylobacterium sp.]GJE07898.1 Carbonic anhydrase 1 [Methylobacterium jeotgali]